MPAPRLRFALSTWEQQISVRCWSASLCVAIHHACWFACNVEIFLDDQDKVASTVADLFNWPLTWRSSQLICQRLNVRDSSLFLGVWRRSDSGNNRFSSCAYTFTTAIAATQTDTLIILSNRTYRGVADTSHYRTQTALYYDLTCYIVRDSFIASLFWLWFIMSAWFIMNIKIMSHHFLPSVLQEMESLRG